jgi:hypothetical protein
LGNAGIALLSFARYDEGSEMDEQERTDPEEQEQEPKLGDLEVPDEQGDAVKGGADERHAGEIIIES